MVKQLLLLSYYLACLVVGYLIWGWSWLFGNYYAMKAMIDHN